MGLSEIFIRVLCIGSVLLYAASASLITHPQVQLAPNIATQLLQIKDNQTSKFLAISVEEQFLLSKISSRVNSLDALFRTIGNLQKPLTIVIDKDRPLRASLGATDIILGTQVIKAAGQLEHAIVKAWIRQVGTSEVLNNPVRAEVYADLLLATYFGELNLQDPGNKQIAEFAGVASWVDDLFGTAELCVSAWRPVELVSYCGGVTQNGHKTQSSYSLRKVLGNLVWSDINAVSIRDKRAVLVELSRNISSQVRSVEILKSIRETQSDEAKNSIELLQASIEREALEIYPKLISSLPSVTPKIGLLRENKMTLVNGFQVDGREALSFKKMIIESCAAPTLAQLLASTTDATEHILLVQNCREKRMNYSGFAKMGAVRFASDNRDAKFAYLHRSSLKLANKMIHNFDVQAALAFDPESKGAKFLGLDQKIFREDIGAYKVNGPIGAIEWYRATISSSKSPNA